MVMHNYLGLEVFLTAEIHDFCHRFSSVQSYAFGSRREFCSFSGYIEGYLGNEFGRTEICKQESLSSIECSLRF